MSLFQRLFRTEPKSQGGSRAAAPRTWRGIQQASRRAPSSPPARQYHVQKLLKVWLGLLATATALVAMGYGVVFVRDQAERVNAMSPPVTLREIAFSTDGVLTADWAREVLGDPIGQPMSTIDLGQVRATIEQHRQIIHAQVALQFPDRLQVTIEERVPLLRARIRGQHGGIEELLFARDGVAYHGRNYPEAALRNLPMLSGVRLQRTPEGLAPVAGLESVDALLRSAREMVPDLLADWRTVSLERFRSGPDAPGALLIVRGHMIPEVVFQPTDFPAQLAQLSRIVAYAREAGHRDFQRIDLSFGEQAYVSWQGPVAAAPASRRSR